MFDALGDYASMRVGHGNELIGLGFRGVRGQTVATFGIVWIAGNAKIEYCAFWDNGKVPGYLLFLLQRST